MAAALRRKHDGDAVVLSELLRGYVGELVPVVPRTAGVLQSLISLRATAGGQRPRCRLQLIAGLFGRFANGVELVFRRRLDSQLACGAKGAVDQAQHLRGAERTRLCGLEGIKKGFQCAGYLGLTLPENLEEPLRPFRSNRLARREQLVKMLLQGGAVVGFARGALRFFLDELVLHIEVAYAACGAPQFLALLKQSGGGGSKGRQAGHELQQSNLRFDAASFGAQFVNRALVWLSQAYR